jgi:hypothetical protein
MLLLKLGIVKDNDVFIRDAIARKMLDVYLSNGIHNR